MDVNIFQYTVQLSNNWNFELSQYNTIWYTSWAKDWMKTFFSYLIPKIPISGVHTSEFEFIDLTNGAFESSGVQTNLSSFQTWNAFVQKRMLRKIVLPITVDRWGTSDHFP